MTRYRAAESSKELSAWPLRCSANPALPAAAFCTKCSHPFSGKFLGIQRDGRALCFTCAGRDDIELIASASVEPESDPILSRGWWATIRDVTLHPHRTFAVRSEGALGAALVFGFVTTMCGFAVTTGWNLIISGDAFLEMYIEAAARTDLSLDHGQVRRILWLSVPLISTLRLGLGALLLHLGRLDFEDERIS